MEGRSSQMLENGSRFGNYRVSSLLGRGGAGEVYLVEDDMAGACHAVKILRAGTEEAEARFIREAEFAMSLKHPNLVAVREAGRDPETGLCYLTMEYMPRGSLRALLDRCGRLKAAQAASIAADIAAALAVIEAHGLVHRDVKPGNILLASDGSAKLADLGISRASGIDADMGVTQAEDVVGTPAYMAPEQMLDSRTVDMRADIYSLGVAMYEMLAGRRPYEGENAMTTLANALDGRPPPDLREVLPDCPPPLASLVSAMMRPNREDRPASARQVLALLAHPERVAQTLQNAGEGPSPWYRDRSVLYALAALVISLEVLVVAIASAILRR